MNKNVTIILDGQAGSCGKGKICGYIAQKDNISISTNNWSSNAGHTYIKDNQERIVVSHLPIAMINTNTKLCINAGAVITPEILENELIKYKDILGERKVYIHPRAMIINEKHRQQEKNLIRSGSTFKGCGAALAEKIMRLPQTELIKDYYNNFSDYAKSKIEITDTSIILNQSEDSILIEGAQGADLDINYGLDYPNVTSRQCSSSQLIADSGISPFKVKDIIMIIRPYPIRISNSTNIGIDVYSGDYAGSQELTWNEIKQRCNSDIDIQEYTTVTKKIRRVFEMNWDRLKYNVMINQPTQIVLNFAQYIDWKAYRCNNYELLPQKVKGFIHKIENITNVSVTMIGTGERNCDIIDLRKIEKI